MQWQLDRHRFDPKRSINSKVCRMIPGCRSNQCRLRCSQTVHVLVFRSIHIYRVRIPVAHKVRSRCYIPPVPATPGMSPLRNRLGARFFKFFEMTLTRDDVPSTASGRTRMSGTRHSSGPGKMSGISSRNRTTSTLIRRRFVVPAQRFSPREARHFRMPCSRWILGIVRSNQRGAATHAAR